MIQSEKQPEPEPRTAEQEFEKWWRLTGQHRYPELPKAWAKDVFMRGWHGCSLSIAQQGEKATGIF